MKLQFTGERFIPGMQGIIDAEHRHRYLIAGALSACKDVLDVASGEGYGSHFLSQFAKSVVGVDIDGNAVTHAQKSYVAPNLRYLLGDCTELPIEDASIDLVVSFETIEHHDRHESMMREICRVLRPGGVLLISSPNRPEYDKTLDKPNIYHVKELDFAEFSGLLDGHFRNTKFYAQRVLAGSILVPFQHEEGGFRNAAIEASGFENELIRPIYFIALASNGDLPGLGTTVFEMPQNSDAVSIEKQLEARVYVSEEVDGGVRPFSEERTASQCYVMDCQRQILRLDMPEDLQPICKLRLDIANGPTAVCLHALTLHQADGREIWNWDGRTEAFQGMSGLFAWSENAEVLLLCVSGDPQFELLIPPAKRVLIRGGDFMRVEITPKPLLETLPSVLARMGGRPKDSLPALANAHVPIGFSTYLEELSWLLRDQVERKNGVIAAQQAEIESLRDRQQQLYEQVVRAEAQLELLKEYALSDAAKRLERL